MKKFIKIGVFAILTTMLCSCEDIFQVEQPTLNISFADQDRVDLEGVLHAYTNEVLTVDITGDMDIMYQYNGTPGCEYLTADEISTKGGSGKFQFGSYLNHAPSMRQQDCLKFYISTDYTGVKDSMNVCNATWIEIPEEVHQGFDKIGMNETLSQWVDIYDYVDEDSDYVYFAFRYVTDLPSDPTNVLTFGPAWRVQYFDFRRTYDDGRTQYYGLYDPNVEANDVTTHFTFAGFTEGVDWTPEGSIVDEAERVTGAGITSTALNYWRVRARIDNIYDWGCIGPKTSADPGGLLRDDDWLISRKFDLKLPPPNDYAVSLKGTTVDVPETATVMYTEPGEYIISIVAKNLTIKHEKSVVKRLKVKITDPGIE